MGAAHDVGKAINPTGCLQQIEGSIIMGLGHALMEEMIYEDGKLRNGNMVDIPTFVEIDAWEKLAELCGQYLRKGRSVLVDGRLQMDTWEKDGQKLQKLKVRAMTVKFLPLPAPNQSRLTGEPIVIGGDDEAPLPF